MFKTECQTVRQLTFTMVVINLSELEKLVEGLRQLQLQTLYQELLLQLKQ